MEIIIRTHVHQNADRVFQRFDRQLFMALKPPFLSLSLERFDGCKVDDEVHLTIGRGKFRQNWHAKIVAQANTNDEIYFIDEGIRLPYFLAYWRHQHRILRHAPAPFTATIVDHITYRSPWGFLMDVLLFPFLFLQFWLRVPVYKRYFGELL